MAQVNTKCEIVKLEGGSYGLAVVVEGLTYDEASILGHLLHDPVSKAVVQATEGRHTDKTHVVSSRGTTQ